MNLTSEQKTAIKRENEIIIAIKQYLQSEYGVLLDKETLDRRALAIYQKI